MTVFTPLWGYWAWRERSSSKSNKNTQSGVKKGSSYIIIPGNGLGEGVFEPTMDEVTEFCGWFSGSRESR